MEVFLVMLHTFNQNACSANDMANYSLRLHGYVHCQRITQL